VRWRRSSSCRGPSRWVYVESGGLVSYGFDVVDQFRRAASYVDLILKGDKPADSSLSPLRSPAGLRKRSAKRIHVVAECGSNLVHGLTSPWPAARHT
jgi:hypothetical protein